MLRIDCIIFAMVIAVKIYVMVLFKVDFKSNKAVNATHVTATTKAITWKENPSSIVSMELYANNNIHALQLAQEKADAWLKDNK